MAILRIIDTIYSFISFRVRLKVDAKALDASATSLQQAKIQERKNALHRKIKAWADIQQLYMPDLTPVRAREEREAADAAREAHPYEIPLYLPSSLPSRLRGNSTLFKYEFKLRMAQAYEALEELRRHLRMRSQMYYFKDKNSAGQRDNTRSGGLIQNTQDKVDASAAKYRRAREALVSLSRRTGDVGWETQLRELLREDIRAFREDPEDPDSEDDQSQSQDTKNRPRGKQSRLDKQRRAREKQRRARDRLRQGLGEGHKTLSWIWKVIGLKEDGDDTGLQECA